MNNLLVNYNNDLKHKKNYPLENFLKDLTLVVFEKYSSLLSGKELKFNYDNKQKRLEIVEPDLDIVIHLTCLFDNKDQVAKVRFITLSGFALFDEFSNIKHSPIYNDIFSFIQIDTYRTEIGFITLYGAINITLIYSYYNGDCYERYTSTLMNRESPKLIYLDTLDIKEQEVLLKAYNFYQTQKELINEHFPQYYGPSIIVCTTDDCFQNLKVIEMLLI